MSSFSSLARRRRGMLVAALTLGAGACDAGPEPVPYVAPAPGTVYDYGAFTNTVTSSDGWRVRFTDNQGRQAERVGLFLTSDPAEPLEVAPAALDSLWPLELGRELAFRVKRGPETHRWEFRVMAGERVTVPAGTFETVVVQGVQAPELVRSPQTAATVLNSWWYAPSVNAVVRFRTTYLSGPGQGRVVEGELRSIRTAGAAPAGDGGAGDSARPRRQTPNPLRPTPPPTP